MTGLVIAGVTAFFIPWGVDLIVNHSPLPKWINQTAWLGYVLNGVIQIDKSYDFIGTVWIGWLLPTSYSPYYSMACTKIPFETNG